MYRVGRYNVRVVVGSSFVLVRCVFVMARRAVDMGRLWDLSLLIQSSSRWFYLLQSI